LDEKIVSDITVGKLLDPHAFDEDAVIFGAMSVRDKKKAGRQ
jgi:hypothetical protein